MFGHYWAQSQVVAGVCSLAQNETGALIGTAFTARDTMQVVDALGEDGLLRYWGEQAVLVNRVSAYTQRLLCWDHPGKPSPFHVSRQDGQGVARWGCKSV